MGVFSAVEFLQRKKIVNATRTTWMVAIVPLSYKGETRKRVMRAMRNCCGYSESSCLRQRCDHRVPIFFAATVVAQRTHSNSLCALQQWRHTSRGCGNIFSCALTLVQRDYDLERSYVYLTNAQKIKKYML